MKNKLLLTGVILAFVLVGICLYQRGQIAKIKAISERNRANTEALLGEVKHYKTSDSLNAAQVQTLRLSVREFEKFRSEDAALIKSLKTKNRELQSALTAATSTVVEIITPVHDTIIVRDSVPVSAKTLKCGDEWYIFEGVLSGSEFSGQMQMRDFILVAESIQYKRFLGFLWKTKRIKDRRIDVLSKNPHCTIVDVEHTIFDNFNY